ncbi:MAG: AtpZ/AtpI family protein [Bacteroidota bacterium]
MSKPKQPRKRPSDNSYLRYTGMAFQMAATTLVFVYLGYWLDGQFGTEPILLIIFCLLGVFAGLYFALKDFL